MRAAGADAIFPPGTVIAEAAQSLIDGSTSGFGYSQRAPRLSGMRTTTRLRTILQRRANSNIDAADDVRRVRT